MKLKDVAYICFAAFLLLLGSFVFGYGILSSLVLYDQEVVAIIVCTLSMVALFAILGWLLLKCGKEIRDNTIKRIQNRKK